MRFSTCTHYTHLSNPCNLGMKLYVWFFLHIYVMEKIVLNILYVSDSLFAVHHAQTGSKIIYSHNSQVFATPETLIGFHPDAGASFFLSHLPGHLGMHVVDCSFSLYFLHMVLLIWTISGSSVNLIKTSCKVLFLWWTFCPNVNLSQSFMIFL